MNRNAEKFDTCFRSWVMRSCKEWDYNIPTDQYFFDVNNRLPYGLRSTIGYGIREKIILDVGKSKTGSAGFKPKGIAIQKGPYSWFERDNKNKIPRPAWEYYIQVAEYIRLSETFKYKKYKITFEDDLMDIAVYKINEIVVCCEIKEKSGQASRLVSGIKSYETSKTLPAEDRGKDPLRKVKYIVKQRPQYFYIVSIGRRYEYRIDFPKGKQFEMVEDVIPFL